MEGIISWAADLLSLHLFLYPKNNLPYLHKHEEMQQVVKKNACTVYFIGLENKIMLC